MGRILVKLVEVRAEQPIHRKRRQGLAELWFGGPQHRHDAVIDIDDPAIAVRQHQAHRGTVERVPDAQVLDRHFLVARDALAEGLAHVVDGACNRAEFVTAVADDR